MEEGLNKETLEGLYVKEGKSTYEIAKMYGCSITLVRYRCIKYGIKLRPRWKSGIKIKKSVLQKLYVKEGKSPEKIAGMLSCSPITVRARCRQYGIKTRGTKRIKGLKKSLLQKLYIKEGKLIREIAEILGCSRETVRLSCKKFGILLRLKRIEKLDKKALQRLHIKEGKTFKQIASMFKCSVGTVSVRAKMFNIKPRYRRNRRVDIDKSTLRRLYIQEGRSATEIAKILGCSLSRVYKGTREIGL